MAELDTVQRFTSGLPDVLVIVNNRMLDSFCFCPRKKKKKKKVTRGDDYNFSYLLHTK